MWSAKKEKVAGESGGRVHVKSLSKDTTNKTGKINEREDLEVRDVKKPYKRIAGRDHGYGQNCKRGEGWSSKNGRGSTTFRGHAENKTHTLRARKTDVLRGVELGLKSIE